MTAPLADRVIGAGQAAGLATIGITHAAIYDDARAGIEARKASGHHAGMSFTFRKPNRSTDPRTVLPSAEAVVAGAWRYAVDEPDRPAGVQGRIARYAWRDHYADLRGALEASAAVLRDDGYRAVIVADQNAQVDRAAAHRAGIGWWGKNTNLVLDGLGSWFVLGTVVTNAPLDERSAGAPADGCRTCTRCLVNCPTGALVEPGVLDARRCLAWIVQQTGPFPRAYREALGDRLYGCDSCIDVCPPGRRTDDHDLDDRPVPVALGRRRPANPPVPSTPSELPSDQAWVDIVALLASSDDELLDEYGRWYIPKRDPAYLRRNALVVLGNIGDPTKPEQIDVLSTCLRHRNPLVRSHAVWAAARLGRHDLVVDLADDRAPEVQAELALVAAVAPNDRAGSS